MSKDFEVRRITTDVLIIGGGTAGCYAALTLSRDTELSIVIAEKAHIKRSGCLAAGVNAINAYITKGHVPQDYVDYAKKDAAGIVREDLLLTAAEHFNEVTADMEQLGLVILKDENGEYVTRGNRNIKINGENFKPILAKAVQAQENVSILNRVNITKLLTKGGAVYGAVGFSLEDEEAYVIEAKAVLVATGGAAGLYKPNNPGFSRHKMWYPPFNTGAGYAMGIQAGAEMTSFEMRFIALRCKDTIAPTGTIAQGVGARQVNSRGFVYEDKYGLTTSERVYGTVKENQQGNGPCYLQTSGIDKEQEENLLKAYLNMAPSQTLKWIETGELPGEQDVEIEGTEPYIVGGHTASGYWVDTNRETTIHGLYAAGDVAGGCPQKYVTGALAEGELAAKAIEAQLIGNAKVSDGKAGPFENDLAKKAGSSQEKIKKYIEAEAGQEIDAYRHILSEHKSSFTAEELEEAMQKVMDEYAGGISTHYQYNEKQLKLADEKIDQLIALADQLAAENMHELLFVYELKERLIVCKSLIAHLRGRKETRWHSFNENLDYPETDENYFKYVNSRLVDGKLQIILRDIVKEGSYEHTN
ncbi:MAG: adenylylsulfate reductase [Clostridium sp. 44_14]|uniref:adenylyl-sulfate reductase subunit alpha n=1 Tax=Jutongia sp. TaxID=2944204 RepID=UPI00096575CD|nr:MAG: adenylylsulfate reductase [Clostridium sp. 44_14]